MKNVLMVDYYGTCNSEGKAIGHSPKVAQEYRELFLKTDQVDLAASPCVANAVGNAGFGRIYHLPYNIVEQDYNRLSKRVTDKFKILINIHHVFKIRKYDLLWFYRVDFFFLLYMLFAGKTDGKRICLVYQLGCGHGLLGRMIDWVYNRGIRKFDGVIYTQERMKIPVAHALYMPDYWYKKEKYDRFASIPKEEKAVCLGAMNPYKKLEELVEVFNGLEYPLEIAGYFFDRDRAARLKQRVKDNIFINDRILDDVEYYEKLGSARYAVLPYDMEQYKNRTSGILLECAFLGVVPIAPDELLKENGLAGIGYASIDEIGEKIFQSDVLEILGKNQAKVQRDFNEDLIRNRFVEWMSCFDRTERASETGN